MEEISAQCRSGTLFLWSNDNSLPSVTWIWVFLGVTVCDGGFQTSHVNYGLLFVHWVEWWGGRFCRSPMGSSQFSCFTGGWWMVCPYLVKRGFMSH